MLFWIKLYLATLPVFFAIDLLWLGVIAKNIYRAEIGGLLRTEFNWVAAILFYLLFIAGLLFFAVRPSLGQTWQHAALLGAAFGFITYATYDLTNLATLRGWTVSITLIDLAWGTALGAAVAIASYWLARLLG